MFDKDNDGFLSVNELRKIMTTMGKKMKKKEVEEMVLQADIAKNGLIHLKGDKIVKVNDGNTNHFPSDFCSLLIYGPVSAVSVKKSRKSAAKRVQEQCKDNYSSRSGSFSQG